MANIKNFGLRGVGTEVQYGKAGGRVQWDSGNTVFRVLEGDGVTLSNLRVALTPVSGNDAASKNYVDTTAQGLAVKDAVRVATTSGDMSQLTYNATGGPESNGSWSYTGTLVIDGVTLADGDRVLIKDQDENTAEAGANGRGNGIFVVNGSGTVLERAADSDGTPLGELRGGSFVFVQEGTTNDNSGYAISEPDGTISVGNDEITWSQFSGAGSVTAGPGLAQSGSELSLDISSLGDIAIAGSDSLAFYDQSASDDARRTVSDFINDLELLTGAGGSNALTVNTGNGLERNTSGTTVELDLDIAGTTNTATVGSDEMIFHDASATGTNIKRTIDEFITDHGILTGAGGALTASNGVEIDSNDIQLDIVNLGTGTATTTSDLMVFDDASSNAGAGGGAIARTVGSFLDDHGVVQDSDFGTNGLNVRTGAGTYTNVTIEASATAGEEGLSVTNGDGVAGNPTVGLDIASLTLVSSTAGTDQVVVFDGTNNVRANLSDVVAGATVAWNAVTDGTTTANADTSSDTLTFTGQDGISIVVSDDPETITVELASQDLTTTTAVEGADLLMFGDDSSSGNHIARSVTNFLADADVVNSLGGNGFAVQTAADNYTARSIVASTTAGEEGIVITNGDGVASDPTVGVDINGQTNLSAAPASADEFLLYDASAGANVKVTMADVAAAAATLGSDTALTDADGDTTVTVEESADADQIVLKSGLAGNGAQNIATFETANTTNNDEQFKFLNADGEVRMEAGDGGGFGSASTNDIDIRLVPGSNGQVFIGDTGAGLIQADDDNQLTAKGGDAVAADAGDLILEGGDGTSSFASGDVLIRGGTGGAAEGTVFIQDSEEQNVMTFDGVSSAVNYWNATNSATGNNIDLAAEGSDTNVSMTLTPKGTGTVQVPTGYESNISVDEDLVNKAYVDDAISTGAVSGATSSVTSTVDLTSATTQSVGTIPANALILRVTFVVGTASDAATEVTFGDATNGAASYMAASENDPEATGTYVAYDNLTDVGGSSVTANATVTTAGSVGTGTVVIEYRNA